MQQCWLGPETARHPCWAWGQHLPRASPLSITLALVRGAAALGGGGAPRKQPYLILRYAAAPKTSTTTTMTVMVMATMLPVESPSERAALSLPKSQSRSTQPAPRLLPIHPCQPSLVGGNIPSPLPKAPVEDAGHICIFAMASFP